LPALVNASGAQVDTFKQHRQLTHVDLHRITATRHPLGECELSGLETLVTQYEMQEVRVERNILSVSPTRSIHSADGRWSVWASDTIATGEGCSYALEKASCTRCPRGGPTGSRLKQRSPSGGRAVSS
jgi:hypothetical protein